MKEQYLEAGKIVNTHGIKGEVRVQPWTDSPEFFAGLTRVYIDGRPVRLLHARVHKDMVIAQLEGVPDVDAAMRLKNRTVYLDRADVELPEDTFFQRDILGASVVDESGAELGKLTDILELPASDVYVVKGEREIMIPVVPEFIMSTDVENGVVTVRLIEGM